MANILRKFIGTKSDKDIKVLMPILNDIKEVYDTISKLSNDELRGKTQEFKQKISEYVKSDEDQILELRQQIEQQSDLDIDEKEKIYENIDQLAKDSYEKSQEILNEILPEAFSVMKETAKRFKENEIVEVTATQMDKDLASKRDSINIVGNKARFSNSWSAGGNVITWDMVHYDVQLIGGIVLHQGKIAEMATGEGKTLVATLPIYLNALPGKGVHIVTVNNYLAKRDSEWMGMLFEFQVQQFRLQYPEG